MNSTSGGASSPSTDGLQASGGARRSWWRKGLGALGRVAKWAGLCLLLFVAVVLVQGWRAFGHRATGERRARMERSPQWSDGSFHNPQPLVNDAWRTIKGLLDVSPHASPNEQLPIEQVDPRRFDVPPPGGLRITWLGHASMLVEIDGVRVLTDPIWSERVGPIGWLGPRRYYPPPIALDDLPPLDAVVVSHDHYDHLDYRTIVALARRPATLFIVPLGVGAHLAYWGVPESRIVERDWWERTPVGPIEVVTTPARHASGRMLFDNDATLWAGYALVGRAHRVFFSGDTGLFPALAQIGERLGPFDATLIETGQYHAGWPDWHIGPERAVEAHRLVRGRVMLPVHWALLTLAYHGWTEPVERVLAAAGQAGVQVLTPRPGQSVEPALTPPIARWWPSLPWHTAAEDPLVSTITR